MSIDKETGRQTIDQSKEYAEKKVYLEPAQALAALREITKEPGRKELLLSYLDKQFSQSSPFPGDNPEQRVERMARLRSIISGNASSITSQDKGTLKAFMDSFVKKGVTWLKTGTIGNTMDMDLDF